MRYFVIVVNVSAILFLIFGMAMLGARVYSAGSMSPIEVVGFALQVILIVMLSFAAVVLWKK